MSIADIEAVHQDGEGLGLQSFTHLEWLKPQN